MKRYRDEEAGELRKLIMGLEADGNLATAKVLIAVSCVFFLLAICLVTGIFSAGMWMSAVMTVIGSVMLVTGIVCVKKQGRAKWLKYGQLLLLFLSVFTTNVIIGYKVWLLFALPILSTCRYYNRRFIAQMGMLAILFVIMSAFTNAYFSPVTGLVDLNMVSFSEPGELSYYGWLYNAVMKHGYDAERILSNTIRLSVIPNSMCIVLIVIGCNAYTRRAQEMLLQLREAVTVSKEREEGLKELNESLTEKMNIIGGLSNAYFVCYGVDVLTNRYRPIKEIEFSHSLTEHETTIDAATAAFVEKGVCREDRAKMLEFTDYRSLSGRMADTNTISIEFHGTQPEWEWCRASWIVADRDRTGKAYEFLFVVQEITDNVRERIRREADRENELRLNELRLRTIAEAIHGGFKISRNDPKFTFIMVSEQLAEMLGYVSPMEMLEASGGSMAGITNREDTRREIPHALEDIKAGRMYTMHYRMRCSDGK